MRRVIAISGKRFYGKDTFAALVREAAARRGLPLASYAFADESKRMFAASRPDVELARLLADRGYKEALRPELTAFTVAALAADPLVFCREVTRRIEVSEDDAPALITDLRLRLELDHLRPRFALHVVRLARSDAARTSSGWAFRPGIDDHATETDLDDPALWDQRVVNDDLGALAAAADALVESRLRS